MTPMELSMKKTPHCVHGGMIQERNSRRNRTQAPLQVRGPAVPQRRANPRTSSIR